MSQSQNHARAAPAPNSGPHHHNGQESRWNAAFRQFASACAMFAGSRWAFALAVATLLVWAASGPLFHFSDTWQLVINTATTIVTFLMVFLIQNTQNRDAMALHLKLDELLRAVHGARTRLVDLERLTDEELDQLQKEFERVGRRAAEHERGHRART